MLPLNLQVPDYVAVIKQPMDLSTVISKIDLHQYLSAKDYLKDIDLICSNALEYNPDRDPGGKNLLYYSLYPLFLQYSGPPLFDFQTWPKSLIENMNDYLFASANSDYVFWGGWEASATSVGSSTTSRFLLFCPPVISVFIEGIMESIL